MWTHCITSISHVLKLNGYGGRQAKVNEKSLCFKGWETLVNVADKFNVYPLAGVGYTNWSYRNDVLVKNEQNGSIDKVEVKGTDGRIAINLGGGVEYAVTDNIILNAEMKYQIISNYNQLVLGVGVAYKF